MTENNIYEYRRLKEVAALIRPGDVVAVQTIAEAIQRLNENWEEEYPKEIISDIRTILSEKLGNDVTDDQRSQILDRLLPNVDHVTSKRRVVSEEEKTAAIGRLRRGALDQDVADELEVDVKTVAEVAKRSRAEEGISTA